MKIIKYLASLFLAQVSQASFSIFDKIEIELDFFYLNFCIGARGISL